MIEKIFVICIEPFLYSLSLEAKRYWDINSKDEYFNLCSLTSLCDKYIAKTFNFSNEEEKNIFTKIIELLKSSGFNISRKNINFCINHISF